MDSSAACLDFAVIGHQDSWKNIESFVNGIRKPDQDLLAVEKIKDIFSFIPARDLFRVKVKSKQGSEIIGVYIETFIDPDKLDTAFVRSNLNKVMKAVSVAKKMNAKIVALGGFTSILLEGNSTSISTDQTRFTTGNTLTSAFIVKAIEKAALEKKIDLASATILVIGATGDIGMACVHYIKDKVKKLLLGARNIQRLEKLAFELKQSNLDVKYSVLMQDLIPEAEVIICAASSMGIELSDCKKNVLICDAGYPKNLKVNTDNISNYIFHGGMGQVTSGCQFTPDYSKTFYKYPAPNIIHGCILESMVLAFEKKFENYSEGKGKITNEKMEEIYEMAIKHGVTLAPFYNSNGLW